MKPGTVPDGVVGATVAAVELQSSWDRPRTKGCELTVTLSSGHELYVIEMGITSADATLKAWTGRVGKAVKRATSIVDVPLETGGHQQSLDLTLDDGHRFEGDWLETAGRTDAGPDDVGRDYTFEGTPGVEMGKTMPAKRDRSL